MQDKYIKSRSVPPLGTDAELIIWSPITQQDGIENYSITLENWQLEIYQRLRTNKKNFLYTPPLYLLRKLRDFLVRLKFEDVEFFEMFTSAFHVVKRSKTKES